MRCAHEKRNKNTSAYIQERIKRNKSLSFVLSTLSRFSHVVAYRFRGPRMRLNNGMLITSIDIDVGSKEVGIINKGKNDINMSSCISEYAVGKIEERALPLLLELFNDMEVPVTFAIRGQLAEVETSILDTLLSSSMRHDIGSHSYYHREFKSLSYKEAAEELNMISAAMRKFGITPRSFVYPKNSVAHLKLLEKYGYRCYRDRGGFTRDGMYIEKRGQLYDIHPSLYISQGVSPAFLRKIIDISIAEKLPFHIWFHPWNLGETKKSIERSINNVLFPLFEYAKKKEKNGKLTFETMLSAANKVEMVRYFDSDFVLSQAA